MYIDICSQRNGIARTKQAQKERKKKKRKNRIHSAEEQRCE
jgi:hypothetical protein